MLAMLSMSTFYDEETHAFHRGELCYTEDDIPIYNLYITNIPEEVNEEILGAYFAKFGEVASVVIVQKSRVRYYRYGFVNFVTSLSAAKALKRKNHYIEDRFLLKVKAADSWRQPLKKEENTEDIKTDVSDERSSLLILNDDCILHIFSFLSISDQLKLSQLCQRFQKVFEMFLRLEKRINSEMVERLTLMELKQILRQYGTIIHKVHLSGTMLANKKWRSVNFFLKFCTNLQSLKFNDITGLHISSFEKLSTQLSNLRELKLVNCSVRDKTCSYLTQLKHLEILDLSYNYEITGKDLCKFKHLLELYLRHCGNIQSKCFSSLCQNSKLKVLDIFKCDRLDKTAITNLGNLKDLEKLTVSSSYQTDQLAPIAQLKNLKSLTIQCTNYLRNDLFEELAKNKSDTLEELEIIYVNLNEVQKDCVYKFKKLKKLSVPCVSEVDDNFLKRIAVLPELEELNLSYCDDITPEGVVSIFDTSKSIEHIDVSCCKQFNSDFIIALLEKIKAKRKHIPCKVVVGATRVDRNIMEGPTYIADGELVPLSFDIPNRYYEIDLSDSDDSDDFDYDYDDDLNDELFDLDEHFLAELGGDDLEGYYFINNSLFGFHI